jgi:hypothetical protein
MVFLHDKGIFGIFAAEKNCFRKKSEKREIIFGICRITDRRTKSSEIGVD